jgi:conjugative transfer pilus assembly protein TraH
MMRIFSLLFVLGAALIAPVAVAQSVDRAMTDMFNDLNSAANLTKPRVYKGSRQTSIGGGSVFVRNNIVTPPPLVSVSSPSINAGCGGIDAYSGALSFISKEAMVNYLRSIAANTATYAFKVGITSICPTCAKEMENLQAITQKMNQYMMDSCSAAHAIVDGFAQQQAVNSDAANARTTTGESSDTFKASNQGPGKKSPAADMNPATRSKVVPGNLVWRALKETNTAERFGWSNDSFLEAIMSLSGTVIICTPGTPDCAKAPQGTATRDDPFIRYQPPTLTLMELVYGARGSGPVSELRCAGSHDATGCKTVSVVEESSFVGFADRIRDRLLGNSGSGSYTGGVIGALVHATGGDPDQDRGFLAGLGLYGQIIVDAAKHSEQSARAFADTYAPAGAAQVMYPLARTMLRAARDAIARSPARVGRKAALEQVNEALDQLEKDNRTIAAQSNVSQNNMLSFYKNVRTFWSGMPTNAILK